VAKRKKAKSKAKRRSFKLVSKNKQRAGKKRLNLRGALKVLILVAVVGGIVVGFAFLRKYVKKAVPVSEKTARLELLNVPSWVNEELKQKIYAAAIAYGEDLRLDEDTARHVQQNIEALVAWLGEVRVQVTSESIRIEGQWRKPLAMVKLGLHKCYVDANLVVLDYVPNLNLPIVRVTGIPLMTTIPSTGSLWQRDDLAAAVAILDKLDRMDKLVTPDKPLLYEIDRIDVSNFNGREDSRASHIVFYAKDNTQIIWGAELGTWQRHLEATDEEKIAKLYGYYKEYGSLVNGVKYINLRDPQQNIPLPIDKY